MNNNFNNDFNNAIRIVNQMSSDLRKNMLVFANASQNFMKVALEASNNIRKSLSQVVNSPEFIEGWQNVRRGIIETEKDLNVFKYAMVELGYPPHYALSIRQMRHIARSYESDREDVQKYIAEFLLEFYDSKRLNGILLEWENSKILKKRLPILRNAVMAHDIGMYDLVLPAILSQLEGYLVDLFGVKGQVDGTIQKVLLKHLLLENQVSKYTASFDDAIHKYYSEQILENFEHGKTMKYGMSRHAILHGAGTDFGTQLNSLKLLLLLDYLNHISENLSKESINAANSEISKIRKARRHRTAKKKR